MNDQIAKDAQDTPRTPAPTSSAHSTRGSQGLRRAVVAESARSCEEVQPDGVGDHVDEWRATCCAIHTSPNCTETESASVQLASDRRPDGERTEGYTKQP